MSNPWSWRNGGSQKLRNWLPGKVQVRKQDPVEVSGLRQNARNQAQSVLRTVVRKIEIHDSHEHRRQAGSQYERAIKSNFRFRNVTALRPEFTVGAPDAGVLWIFIHQSRNRFRSSTASQDLVKAAAAGKTDARVRGARMQVDSDG